MAEARFDVTAIGNAIVDVLAHTEEAFLAERDLPKGSITLVSEEQADTLYDQMGPGVESSGGSAGNTVAGISSLGGKAAYIGKVHDDLLGRVFRHDMTAIGVHYTTPPLTEGPSTARCMILVTPDGERTMSTYLGACTTLSPADIDEELVRASKVTYVEGYQWDQPTAKDAIMRAACVAKEAGHKFALSLSDSFCVDRHRAEFLELISGFVDILFANEAEITSLFEVETFEAAIDKVKGHCEIAAITCGAKGSVVVSGDETISVPAEPVHKVVDTTGAGDLYAAGFLFGYTQDRPLKDCAHLGALAAGEIISHVGARPEITLADLVRETATA